jgi:hypothetical protein
MNIPVNLFSDFMELNGITAKGLSVDCFNISSLLGMKELVSAVCNGAWVMLQSHSGIKTFMTQRFPSVTAWHCVNHRAGYQ